MIWENWLQVDESALVQDSPEMMVQVNGKLRGKILVSAGASNAEIETTTLSDTTVLKFIDRQAVKK